MRTGGLAMLAATLLAGCQTTDDETVTVQALTGDYCSATMPTPTPWDGTKPQPAGQSGAWVVYPNHNGKLGGPWLAARVDTVKATVGEVRKLQDAQVPKFMAAIAESRIVGPGTNPPPPPCDYPLACAPMFVVMAAIMIDAPEQAYAKALSCGGQK